MALAEREYCSFCDSLNTMQKRPSKDWPARYAVGNDSLTRKSLIKSQPVSGMKARIPFQRWRLILRKAEEIERS